MTNGGLNWIANYIWGIADDVLRDLYVRGKYRDVILPMTVLSRLNAVLEDSKQAVLAMKATFDAASVVELDPGLRQAGACFLQHLPPHAERPARPRQPPAAHRRLSGVPRRVLAQRAGDPQQLRVPQPDTASVPPRRAGHADREAHLA